MKKILGLDLGTTSIGWAFIHESETDSEQTEIIGAGVRLVPLSKDEIAEFSFVGQGPGSAVPVGGAALTIVVEGTPTGENVPTKFQFGTNNGSSNAIRAELSASGIWKVNAVQGLTNTLSIAGNLLGVVTVSIYTDSST